MKLSDYEYYRTELGVLYNGNVFDVLPMLEKESVDCIITSPPYWSLRNYQSEGAIWDGDKNCKHEWIQHIKKPAGGKGSKSANVGANKNDAANMRDGDTITNFCNKCGAWRGELGLEPDFNLYIKHLIDIFELCRPVLKKTGALWVNLGDTFAGSGCGTNDYRTEASKSIQGVGKNKNLYKTGGIARDIKSIKNKSLVGIPDRFKIAMIDNGWVCRNDIIWHKPSCMPDSAKDRFTVDYERFFFFTKSGDYYFKQQLEPLSTSYANDTRPPGVIRQSLYPNSKYNKTKNYGGVFNKKQHHKYVGVNMSNISGTPNPEGRNKRCVWAINTGQYPGEHFAVYPEALITTPIDACVPKGGVVLDPFMGAGTTAWVCRVKKIRWIGIEINEKYCKEIINNITHHTTIRTLKPEDVVKNQIKLAL